MKRIALELRRLRGWLAWALVVYDPWFIAFHSRTLCGWAGLYAHWDYDRANWSRPSFQEGVE